MNWGCRLSVLFSANIGLLRAPRSLRCVLYGEAFGLAILNTLPLHIPQPLGSGNNFSKTGNRFSEQGFLCSLVYF
jgi:hypothetical protein